MNPKKLMLFVFIGILPWTFLIMGCMERERYTYEQISATYGLRPAHRPGQKEVGRVSEGEALSGPLSLVRAIEISLANNPEIDMAVARIRQSHATIDEAHGLCWPNLSAYWEYSQGDAPSAYLFKTIDQRELPPGVNFNDPGWFENYEVGIRGRMNLYNGGRDLLRRRMAETGLEIHELDRRTVENILVESVIHAYFNALAAKDFIRIARESVRTVEEQRRVVEVRYRAGGALKSDLLSLEVRSAQSQEDLVRAENNASLSLASLAGLLGLDPDTPFTLRDREDVPAKLPEDYRSGLVHALAHRAELKKVRQQIIQSRMALDMARAEYLPRLDAQASYYLDDQNLDFERERENWTAGVILSWEMFAGFSTKARVDKAKNLLEEMLAADRKTLLSIQLELKSAYLRLAEAKARLRVTEASVDQAEESLKLVKKQYEGGSATITRYLDAELSRNSACVRARNAYYDREKALASIGRGIGYWTRYGELGGKGNE
ncbi:MAG: TolC family protein [Desulfobacterales bacterium]|nr:TolC family protein [Desulfobacterales bacterium]